VERPSSNAADALPVLEPYQSCQSCPKGTMIVRDLDLLSPTVMRSRQSSRSVLEKVFLVAERLREFL